LQVGTTNFDYGHASEIELGEHILSQDEEVVRFFLSLPKARRREYEELAELDRRFGENVAAELRSRPDEPRSGDES
jgi:hypothetical protein